MAKESAEDIYLRRSLRTMTVEQLLSVPLLPQTQAALNDQMMDLRAVATRLGMYDAADEIERWLRRK